MQNNYNVVDVFSENGKSLNEIISTFLVSFLDNECSAFLQNE